jgi:hypothetical protein
MSLPAEVAAVPEVPARISFMGGAASVARARVLERSAAWRRSQTFKDLALLLLAPVVALVPPHFPWPPVVVGVSLMRAFNHNREQRTLLWLSGPCPKCGEEQEYRELGRMSTPHHVTCAHCRWDLVAEVSRAPGSPSI